MANINIFKGEVDEAFAQEVLKDIKKATKNSETDTVRGPPASVEGKASRAQRGRSIEIETLENDRFKRLRPYRDDLPEVWFAFTWDYFYLYSNTSFTDYTILVKVKITDQNGKYIDIFRKELENEIIRSSEALDDWFAAFRPGKRRNSWSYVGNKYRKPANKTDGMDGGAQNSDTSGYSEKSSTDGAESGIKGTASRDIDKAYLDAVKRGDMKTAKKMVTDAAINAGYKKRMYHETDKGNIIHVFNLDLNTHSFSDYSTPIGIFTKSHNGPIGLGDKQMELFVKADRIFKVKNREEVASKMPSEYSMFIDEIQKIDKQYEKESERMEDKVLDEFFDWADSTGFDLSDFDVGDTIENQYGDAIPERILSLERGYLKLQEEWDKKTETIAFKNRKWLTKWLRDNHYDSMEIKFDDGGFHKKTTDTLILLDKNQAKSAEPVTYDDDGNIIPLSERFNSKKDDIRFSRDLSKESLEEKIAYLKGEFKLTHGTQLLKKDADRIVRGITKAYSSKTDKESLSTKLQEIFAFCKKGKFEEGHLKAEELAKEIVDNAVTLSSQYGEEYSGVRQYFKDTEIIVSNKIRNDITDFESFRKRNMGKLRIKYGHGNVDTVYQELNSMYPDLFPDDVINASDQLQKMAEVVEMLKPAEINPYEGQAEEAVNAVYEDIIEAVSNTEAHQTFADKKLEEKKQAVQEERDKHSEEIKKLKEYYKKDDLKNITLPDGRKLGELTLAEIYNLKDEDMSTTPKLEALPSTGVDETIGKESKFYGSAMKSENVADETKELIKNVNDIKYYVGITNLETLNAANQKLNEGGSAETLRFISMDKKNATAEDVAEGFILLKRYQDAGDFEGAAIVAQKLREIGTTAGQTVQAFSILGRMTPEGMAVYAQKELDRALEEMKQRHSDKWIEKHKEMFELTPEEMEFIKNNMEMASKLPEGRDKTVLVAEIASMIQAKMPTKLRNQIKAYTRISMLLNSITMLRNALGNVVMFPEFIVQDFIGAGVDALVSKMTGTRTKGAGFSLEAVKATKKGFVESFDDFRRNINTRGVDNDRFEIGNGPAFKSYSKEENLKNPLHALSTALNRLDRVTSWLLDTGDRPFFEYHFTNELNNLMKANKVTEYNAEMIEMATNLALERTWQDNNKYTELVTKLVRILNLGNEWGFGSIVIPFAKTPANLVKALVDYSPAGLANLVASDARKFYASVKNGKPDAKLQRKFVDNLSKAITGTLFMIAFAFFNSKDWITGGDDEEDKDMKAFKQNVLGIAPYSVTVDGRSYTYDWAQPVGGQMAIASDFVQFMNSDKKVKGLKVGAEGAGKAILNALASGGNVLFEQSFLQGMSYLFSEDDFVSGIIRTGTNAVTQFFPTALSQVAQMADPVVRTSYENGDFGKTAWNKVKGKIPFARNTLAPSVDVLGNEVQSYGGRNNFGNIFLNPFNIYSKTASEVAEEIYRVYEETGELSIIPRVAPYYINYDKVKYDFTSHEKADYQKKMGKTTEGIVNGLISSNTYKSLADEEKSKILTAVTDYSNALAKYEYLKAQGKEYERDSWMVKAEEGKKYGLSVADYITAYTITRDVESIKDKNGETIDNSKGLQIMEKVYSIKGLSDKERKYLFESLGVGKKIQHYSKALVESKLNKMR